MACDLAHVAYGLHPAEPLLYEYTWYLRWRARGAPLAYFHHNERRAVDYLQPDVTKVGGLTEEHRIGQYADEHAIMLVPHGWNTAVGLAADLQLVAAAGNARWVEYITPAPYIEDLCETPPKLDENGMLRIPDGPGLGFRWNPDGIAKHTG